MAQTASVVFRSYAALVHLALKEEMQRVERLPTAETNAGLLESEQVQASTDLHHLLMHSTSGPTLDRVVNGGSAEGLRAWQLLVERYDPHIRSRTAGQLLSLLQFDFSGDMLVKLEAYERDLALCEQASGEKISDALRVGILLNRVTDTELATHLLLNSERFLTWALFRRELADVSRARAAASGAYQMRRGANDSSTAPMEIDALQQHGDKKCLTCGRYCHLAKDCWQDKSKSKGKDSKGEGGKKGMGKSMVKTDKDVWTTRPSTDKTGRTMQATAGGTMAKSGRHRRSRAQLRVSGLRRLSRWPSQRRDGWTVAGEPDGCGGK